MPTRRHPAAPPPQEPIDCLVSSNNGCDGSQLGPAGAYIGWAGIASSDDYPYVAEKQACRSPLPPRVPNVLTTRNPGQVPVAESMLYQMLIDGPVAGERRRRAGRWVVHYAVWRAAAWCVVGDVSIHANPAIQQLQHAQRTLNQKPSSPVDITVNDEWFEYGGEPNWPPQRDTRIKRIQRACCGNSTSIRTSMKPRATAPAPPPAPPAGGIFNPESCTNPYFSFSTRIQDHSVVVVGMGVDKESDQPYWLIRNSWGTNWVGVGSLHAGMHACIRAGLCLPSCLHACLRGRAPVDHVLALNWPCSRPKGCSHSTAHS